MATIDKRNKKPMITASRRRFIQTSVLGVAMAGLYGKPQSLLADPLGLPIGVQLYTLNEELQKDFQGTLQKVAAIGYREVELAGLPAELTIAELGQAFKDAGLRCRSAHYNLPMLLPDLDRQIEHAQQLGLEYMICAAPWVADNSRLQPAVAGEHPYAPFLKLLLSFTLDDWKWNAEQFNKVGAAVKKAGMQFGYHNHSFEFKQFDGKIAFDELLRMTDPNLVVIEMDCGWTVSAGYDPVTYFKKYPGRFPLLHVKDVKKGAKTNQGFEIDGTEIGQGSIDWRKVFEAGRKTGGVKGYYVEQEPPFARPVLEELKISYDYLHSLKV
jgi:sugar phosphate isomerase/epimerase